MKNNCDIGIPFIKFKKALGFSSEFWLKSVVQINYVGKVFSVLTLFKEALIQNESEIDSWDTNDKLVCYSYILFMLLGTYWYTHFWGSKEDREAFFSHYKMRKKNDCVHALSFVDPKYIVFGAASYYILYGVLFNHISKNKDKYNLKNLFRTLSAWNLLAAGNFLMLLWSMYDKK